MYCYSSSYLHFCLLVNDSCAPNLTLESSNVWNVFKGEYKEIGISNMKKVYVKYIDSQVLYLHFDYTSETDGTWMVSYIVFSD